MNGFVNLLKPCGMSSSDAVFRVRRATGQKHCGHMGTLDPGAAGVLPVAVGKASRLFDCLLGKEKVYRAVFRFGIATDTLDSYGAVTERGGRIPSEPEILDALPALCGDVLQRAPVFSAKKIGGKKGYELARAGKVYEAPQKQVRIEEIRLLGQCGEDCFAFDVRCGGGTYIRSIARDLASALGTVAYMRSLIRTASGNFRIADAITPEELAECAERGEIPLLAPEFAVREFSRADVPEAWAFRFENGVPIPETEVSFSEISAESAEIGSDLLFRIYSKNEFFGMGALVEQESGGRALRLKSRIREENGHD